jgi:hypothetical protein
MIRTPRALFGLCTLASTLALAAPAGAAGPYDQTYDAVNAYEVLLRNGQDTEYRAFSLTGVLRGQSAAQTVTYKFYDNATANMFAPVCERLALIAMKDAGHYAFVVVSDPTYGVTNGAITSCRLERR